MIWKQLSGDDWLPSSSKSDSFLDCFLFIGKFEDPGDANLRLKSLLLAESALENLEELRGDGLNC